MRSDFSSPSKSSSKSKDLLLLLSFGVAELNAPLISMGVLEILLVSEPRGARFKCIVVLTTGVFMTVVFKTLIYLKHEKFVF